MDEHEGLCNRDESNRESALRIKRLEQTDKLAGGVGRYKGAIRNWQRTILGQIERRLEKATSQEVAFFICASQKVSNGNVAISLAS